MRARHLLAVALILTATSCRAEDASRALGEYASCDHFLPAPRVIPGATVGPESCMMQAAEIVDAGRAYVRVDLGLNGTAEGYVTKEGTYHEYLTNGPDLIFAQAATPGERHLAVARYERAKGAAILLVYPQEDRKSVV